MSTEMATLGSSEFPLRLDVEYPEQLNRWLVLVKWLLAIPHILIVYALVNVASVIQFIAFFAILFTTKYPQPLFEFVVNIYRWQANLYAYLGLMRDEYPPFSWEPGQYPVTFEIDYPPELNRWMPLVKWLLAFPHYVALFFPGHCCGSCPGDRVLCDPLHSRLPARNVRLLPRRPALGQPRERLRLLHARRISAVQPEVGTR